MSFAVVLGIGVVGGVGAIARFLLDGAVAGGWRYEKGRIELQPFRKLTRAERAELKDEGERLAAFHA
jgi:hypothetical protein